MAFILHSHSCRSQCIRKEVKFVKTLFLVDNISIANTDRGLVTRQISSVGYQLLSHWILFRYLTDLCYSSK